MDEGGIFLTARERIDRKESEGSIIWSAVIKVFRIAAFDPE